MSLQIEAQINSLIGKIKHYLITVMGVTIDEAKENEFYRAFCMTLREEIMINWTASAHSIIKEKPRRLYYLCMEYMPGRFLWNNVNNINATDLIQGVLKKTNRDLSGLLKMEPDPGLGNGGLGRLAACFLDSLATHNYPAIAYGIRYQYGIFDQEMWNGQQVERPDSWLLYENPWEFRRDAHAVNVRYCGRIIPSYNAKGEESPDIADFEEVRALAYDIPIIGYKETSNFNVTTLRLWSTKESPRNFELQRFNAGQIDQAAENISLTDVLYPNDNNENGKRIRLKQEFLLTSASLQDIIREHLSVFPDMSSFADKARIQINDTHAALAIAELMRLLIRFHNFSWEEARETVRICCSFTNHTVLKESLEEWNQHRMQLLLPRQYHIIERLNQEFCDEIRAKYPGNEDKVRAMSIIHNGQVRMANLAIYGSHKVNGVAKLHTEILKKDIFSDFDAMYPDRFVNVTNGVTQRRWLLSCNPELSKFISSRIGDKWKTDFTEIAKLANFASDPQTQQEFLEIKKNNKKHFLAYIKESNPIRDIYGKPVEEYHLLDENALFDVQIKRIHEYKRQLMNILHVLMVYLEIKHNPMTKRIPRMVFIGGKAAPGYVLAKNILQLFYCVARKINNDIDVNQVLRVCFLENYNVSRAEVIIPAADLSEQISTAGMEASGTGNMKLTMNGALTIGTEDGANVEMHAAVTDAWWPFSFGASSDENAKLSREKSYNPWDIYHKEPLIKEVMDFMIGDGLAETQEERDAIRNVYNCIMQGSSSGQADRYFVLNDLLGYYETHKKVEALYLQRQKWAEFAIHNIASMGTFSTDHSIHNYANLIWGLDRVPINEEEFARVRQEFSEHDQCRIW